MAKLSPQTVGLLRELRQAQAKFEHAVLRAAPRQGAAIARLMSSIDATRAARMLIGAH